MSLCTSNNMSAQQQQSSSSSTTSMATFAVKLMSLDANELRCLNADHEIMRHISKAQSLMESRLQDIHAKQSQGILVDENGRNKLSQQPLNLNNITYHNQRQQQELQQQQQHQHQHHHQQQMLLSPNSFYNNYYAKQLALNQYAQMQQEQQQQLIFMASRLYNSDSNNHNSINVTVNSGPQVNNNLSATTPLTSNKVNHMNNTIQQVTIQPQMHTTAPALDLRTTPTRPLSAQSATPSPIDHLSGGSGSSTNNHNKRSAPLPPKKMQSSEYKKIHQMNESNRNSDRVNNTLSDLSHAQCLSRLSSASTESDQNRKPISSDKRETTHANNNKRPHNDAEPTFVANRSSIRQQQQLTKSCSMNTATGKKYKGEFDEPTPTEVAEREHLLNRPGHYHQRAVESGECACVIGSDFRDKTKREALELLEKWRSMNLEDRIKWKWDVSDLPEDIHLSEIKKYEDLRRDYSSGRADFGGASKRKPLSIRGTRQFLLMLYCLWGHPGREDPMQKDGFCPHCFAKIRTDNEQSTLVRVVNHFNMKHRRGANPRLSPHLESRNSPQLASPQSHQVVDTLLSVVENAVAAVEVDNGPLDANKDDCHESPSQNNSDRDDDPNDRSVCGKELEKNSDASITKRNSVQHDTRPTSEISDDEAHKEDRDT